jgi:hypothetical protein
MSVETRRSVKSHASDAWKRRLRADVLERVRAHRAALLTRARGDGSSPGDGLRTLLNDGLREILHDAIDTETRRRMSQDPDDSDDGMWDDVIADPRTDARAASAACARTDPPTTSGSGPKGLSVQSRQKTSRDDSEPLVSTPSSRATWNELLALGFTDVEYDSLMAEMHRGFEEEIREEEARMLALELEKTELLENEETRDACERHERWIASRDEDGDEGTKHKARQQKKCCVPCASSRVCCRQEARYSANAAACVCRAPIRRARGTPAALSGAKRFRLQRYARVWRVYSRRTARTDVTARSCSP